MAISPIDLIKGKEGLRLEAYPDVGGKSGKDFAGYRVGYGSDTYTTEDGKVHRVTKDTVITQADADRDVARRAQESINQVVNKVGQSAWDALTPEAQAVAASMVYNYTSIKKLPTMVRLIKDGDLEGLANYVEKRGVDNSGVNKSRRIAEAQIVRDGGFNAVGSRIDNQTKTTDAKLPTIAEPDTALAYDDSANKGPTVASEGLTAITDATSGYTNPFEPATMSKELQIKTMRRLGNVEDTPAAKALSIYEPDTALIGGDFNPNSSKMLSATTPKTLNEEGSTQSFRAGMLEHIMETSARGKDGNVDPVASGKFPDNALPVIGDPGELVPSQPLKVDPVQQPKVSGADEAINVGIGMIPGVPGVVDPLLRKLGTDAGLIEHKKFGPATQAEADAAAYTESQNDGSLIKKKKKIGTSEVNDPGSKMLKPGVVSLDQIPDTGGAPQGQGSQPKRRTVVDSQGNIYNPPGTDTVYEHPNKYGNTTEERRQYQQNSLAHRLGYT